MNVPSEGDQLASLTIELQGRFGDAEALEVLLVVLRDLYPNRVAVVSSFGAESAVLLHLVATIDPATPILFVDTRRHF
ncbi:MAG: phosphoadenosine phosphosulfate reductase family protein, partial [Reyranella sp.]|nr:phosphoadenosine phosphosulfate reductase family protein [Reyranella sp.]